MDELLKLIDKLEFIRDNQEVFVAEAVEDNENVIAELNREQLSEGLKNDGEFLPDYSPTSVRVFGKRPGPIQLFDTGDFYESIGVDLMQNAFEVDATDEKTAELEARYDDSQGQILGLTDESLQEFIDNEFFSTLVELNEQFLLR